MLILDVSRHGADSGDQCAPIIAIACTRDDIRDQIQRHNEIAERPNDDTFRPLGRILVLEAVEKRESGEQGFLAGHSCDFLQLGPQPWSGIPMGSRNSLRQHWIFWHFREKISPGSKPIRDVPNMRHNMPTRKKKDVQIA